MVDPRPPIKIRLKINKLTGAIEELIVDDQARLASEDYHDKVAELVARALGKHADILDTALEANRERPPEVRAADERLRETEPGSTGGAP